MKQLEQLVETTKILTDARRALCKEPLPIYLKVSNAVVYIEKQITELISDTV